MNDTSINKDSFYIKCRNIIFDGLILISIATCIFCIIYSTITFVHSRIEQSNAIEKYTGMIVSNINQTDQENNTNQTDQEGNTIQTDQESGKTDQDMKIMLDYAMQLQEIEAKSTQTDVISFIYAFISGTLIGVASFFIKNSADNTQKIENSKNKINEISERAVTFENKAMLLEFQTYVIMIENAVHNLRFLSLNTAPSSDNYIRFQDDCVVNINDLIVKIQNLFNNYELTLQYSDIETKKTFRGMIIKTVSTVDTLKINTELFQKTVNEWDKSLNELSNKIKSKG